MRKFLYPLPLVALLCVFFFNCTNEGFEKPKDSEMAKLARLDSLLNIGSDSLLNIKDTIVKCFVGESCYEINNIACLAMGGEEKPDKDCVSFTCEWKSNSVEYGQKSTLSFKWGNAAQKGDCSYAISYKENKLDTIEYTISRGTIFSDLPFSKATSIDAIATVTCGTKTIEQKCRSLQVKPVPFNFTCGWDSTSVKYGGKRTFSFAFNDQASADIAKKEACALKMFPLDTGVARLISASTIAGLSYLKDTTIVATATVNCGADSIVQNCKPLTIKSVPGPEKEGKLSFKKFDYENYFFVGTKIDTTNIINGIKITNKEEAGCGDIKIKIEGSPAKFGTQVRATAVVTCEHIGEFELDGISAEVLPDYKIGKCELTKDSKPTMLSKDTLTVGIDTVDSYGRCNKIEYSFNGTTYTSSNSFALTNSGNTDLKNIKAKVTCSGKDTTVACPTVTVASYIDWKKCGDNKFNISKGSTIFEFACDEAKTDYYFRCSGSPHNFTIEVEGYKEGNGNDNIRPNGGDNGYNLPGIQTITEGGLYRYPKQVIVKTQEAKLECTIW